MSDLLICCGSMLIINEISNSYSSTNNIRGVNMKTLVTGATGLIGSSLVRELQKDGKEVKVLIREKSDTSLIDGLDLERCYGDIRNGDSVKRALEGCDTFYQTAALYATWVPDKKLLYDINVEGTKTALNAALEKGVEKVVYTSSVASIGPQGADKEANEESEFTLQNSGEHYCISKYLGEIEAKKICERGLPVVIVNPSGVIGVRDIKPTPTGQIIVNLLNKKLPGYLDGGMNMVDVEDVARGHILAAQHGRVGERYILGNENMTLQAYFNLVCEVAGIKPPTMKIPGTVAIAAAYFYQFISKLTGRPPLMTVPLARLGASYAYYDVSKAVNELGLPRTPIKETIGKAVNWFRENGYVKAR